MSAAAAWLVAVPRLIEGARRDLGVREVTPNWSPRIKAMLAVCGIRDPAPWCAAAVATWGRENVGGWPIPPFAGCASLGDWARRHGVLSKDPALGAVALFYFPALGRFAHTGIVSETLDSAMRCLEGNTNPAGGREGYGVFERDRPIASSTRFIHWWEYAAIRAR